ncbi:carbonic anhydrase [Streptomyces orinoci]|uniref:carbonic anhydrase n=1 Tax=Streptomyces orinoci TaxID=67339 RepID=A0ABV3JXN2_STRON|nr:carbonic anhydrase [Streptomyces orinoci]
MQAEATPPPSSANTVEPLPTARPGRRRDLPFAVAVSLSALVLSLAIALAVAAPPQTGLIAAMAGGLAAAALGTSPLYAGRPAIAGLVVVMAELVLHHGWRVACAIAALAGLLQLAVGVRRVGQAALGLGRSALSGMLAGVGLTIALGQLPAALGGAGPAAAHQEWGRPHPPALMIALVTAAALLLWPKLPGRWGNWARVIPAPIAAVAVGTAMSGWLELPRAPWLAQQLSSPPPLVDTPVWGALAAALALTLAASAQALLAARELASGEGPDVATAPEGGRVSLRLTLGWVAGVGLLAGFSGVIPLAALAAVVMVSGVRMGRLRRPGQGRQMGELALYALALTAVVLLGVLPGVLTALGLAVLCSLGQCIHTRFGVRRETAGRPTTEPSGPHIHRPWTPWRHHHFTRPGTPGDADTGRDGRQLVGGISAFQRNTAPLVRDELARLARDGQRPSELFLTCADSRLVTSMITSSGPGDLFTVRNVGNLMPPPGSDSSCDSVGAAVEYAVEVLKVGSITVCGHSGCGAMQALLDTGTLPGPGRPDQGTDPNDLTSLGRWLRHGQPSLARMQRIGRLGRGEVALAERAVADDVERLALVNVMQQLDHLMAYGCVARRVAEGSLRLQGMYFHVAEAQAYVLDRGSRTFAAVRPGVLDAV